MFRWNGPALWCALLIPAGIMFTHLGSPRLWDRDEPRNAGCAAEMMQRGDWVVPMFNDELRAQKPVLLYWLIGSAYQVFGVNEFAARFWSAICAIGTVVLTYTIGRHLFNSAVGCCSAVALASSLMFVVAGRAATPDSVLIFFQTLTLAIYVLSTFARRESPDEPISLRVPGKWFPQSPVAVTAMYVAIGLGVLAKGPVGLVMPLAILGVFLLIQTAPTSTAALVKSQRIWPRIRKQLVSMLHPVHCWRTAGSMKLVFGAVVVTLIAVPWFAWVGIRTDGEFLRRFFLTENLGRAATAFENHRGGIWYYPVAIAIGFFPWSIFLATMGLALVRLRGKSASDGIGLRLMICWIAVQVGVFSLAATKLPSYVTPCYPALAICCGWTLVQLTAGRLHLPRWWMQGIVISLGMIGAGITAGLAVVCGQMVPGIRWPIALGMIWIVAAGIGWIQLRQARWDRWLKVFAASAVVFAIGLFGFAATAISRSQATDQLLGAIRERGHPVAAYRCLESSWVYYAGLPIGELATEPDEVEQTVDRQRFWEPKPRCDPAEFARRFPSGSIITTEDAWNQLRAELPPHFGIVSRVPFFMRSGDLLLIAPNDPTQVADQENDVNVSR